MRPGFAEGGGGGDGAGAGGFCANAGDTRSPMASAGRANMRGHECIGLSRGENVSTANLVGESVQVKANNVYQWQTTAKTFDAVYFPSKVTVKTSAVRRKPATRTARTCLNPIDRVWLLLE